MNGTISLENFKSGALVDGRTESDKLKDYLFSEIVSSPDPVNWVEKKKSDYRKFPIFSQNGSGSCVAQTGAKILGISYFLKNKTYVHFSATHLYQRRKNKPNGGMAGVDAFNIIREGVTLEELVPSQSMTDKEMDGIVIPKYKDDVGKIFKVSNFIILPSGDIDTIASVIQKTGKGVMVWFYFQRSEWTDVPTVKNTSLVRGASTTSRHSVTAVDFTLYKGKKALVIEDSWGVNAGIGGQRIITEDFFKARNWFAGYLMEFKFEEVEVVKPKYFFQNDLTFGMTNNDSVKALQEVLQNLGYFPKNTSCTGYYGAITATAVVKFQTERTKISASEIKSLAGKKVGPKTREALNNL